MGRKQTPTNQITVPIEQLQVVPLPGETVTAPLEDLNVPSRPSPMFANGITLPESVKVTEPPAWYQPGGDQVLDNIRALLGTAKGAGKELLQQGMRGGAMLRQVPGVDEIANALPSIPVGNMESSTDAERTGKLLLDALEFGRAGALTKGLDIGGLVRALTGAGINTGLAQVQGQGPAGTAVSALLGAAPEAVNAIPRSSRAAKKFEDVMAAAGDQPVSVGKTGASAMRIQELVSRGGSMPKAVKNFLQRITNPDLGPLTYREARDFYSNITRLSANEQNRLSPVIARELANMRQALDAANAAAAGEAGKEVVYREAMNEYRKAAQLKRLGGKVAPYAAGAVGGGALYKLFGDKVRLP